MKTKQIILMLLVLILPLEAWCQLEKGSYLGTASAGLAFSTVTDLSNADDYRSGNIDLSINSGFGIFVINRLAIGPGFSINTGYSYFRDESISNPVDKQNEISYSLSLDPFVRYYFFNSGKFAMFGQVSGMIGYGQQFFRFKFGTSDEQKETNNTLTYGGGVALGFVYFITQNTGLETSLGYQIGGQQFKESGDDSTNKLTNGELAVNVGLSFYLGKCKKEEKKEKKENEEKKE